jgi:U3 small nucleolar RNA-associated protein 10
VGNDYLPLLPDTLPFLAELLEDADENVRILAQKVALLLRDLSGEDISEFLK